MRAKPFLADYDFVMNRPAISETRYRSSIRWKGGIPWNADISTTGCSVPQNANRKASPILEAIVSLYFGENEEERASASDTLRQIAENYKQFK